MAMSGSPTPVYRQLLKLDRSGSMVDGDRRFRGDDGVYRALRNFVQRVERLGVPNVVVGALALGAHGFRRPTVGVDLLVTREGLQTIHDHLAGRGYIRLFGRSQGLCDTEHGARVEFLVTGEFPGDGKSKSVAFPEPSGVSVKIDGTRYLGLRALIELKLASGKTHPGRLNDLADVRGIITILDFPDDFAAGLDPYVRAGDRERWRGAKSGARALGLGVAVGIARRAIAAEL